MGKKKELKAKIADLEERISRLEGDRIDLMRNYLKDVGKRPYRKPTLEEIGEALKEVYAPVVLDDTPIGNKFVDTLNAGDGEVGECNAEED